jgi:hypothetical protein
LIKVVISPSTRTIVSIYRLLLARYLPVLAALGEIHDIETNEEG